MTGRTKLKTNHINVKFASITVSHLNCWSNGKIKAII